MSESQSIPKILHYCWFGGNPKSDVIIKCMESWKRYCPDYRIMEWNEDNFDINSNKFAKEAYECKRWAFVSDYVRLWALKNYGGIYVDTDLEILKPIDDFLKHRAFSGFESTQYIPTAIMGAEINHPWIGDLLSHYDCLGFVKEDGTHHDEANVHYMTKMTQELYGLVRDDSYQILKHDLHIYPHNVFCPTLDLIFQITADTHTIHHFTGTWLNEELYDERVQIREKINDSPFARFLYDTKGGKALIRLMYCLYSIPIYIKNDKVSISIVKKAVRFLFLKS